MKLSYRREQKYQLFVLFSTRLFLFAYIKLNSSRVTENVTWSPVFVKEFRVRSKFPAYWIPRGFGGICARIKKLNHDDRLEVFFP